MLEQNNMQNMPERLHLGDVIADVAGVVAAIGDFVGAWRASKQAVERRNRIPAQLTHPIVQSVVTAELPSLGEE